MRFYNVFTFHLVHIFFIDNALFQMGQQCLEVQWLKQKSHLPQPCILEALDT